VKKVPVILLALAVVGGPAGLFLTSTHTTVELTPPHTIGASTPVVMTVSNAHGTRSVTASLEQNGARYPLMDQRTTPVRRFRILKQQPSRTVVFEAGRKEAPQLKEGAAKLVIEAVSNDFAAHTDRFSYDVNVVLQAPRVGPDGLQHYINQGGSEMVTFTLSGSAEESGVRVGKYSFRSFAMPGQDPSARFALFAYPWDLGPDEIPVVFAHGAAGDDVTGRFTYKTFPKKFRVRDFNIDDALMSKLVNSVDPSGKLAPGPDLVSRFLKINGELRKKNNQQIADLRLKTANKQFWNGAFLHWGKEEADFADVRNYIYHGQKIDQQVHLGFDLSDTANAPVHSANDGRVVWAADLGIYGNCVVVDHGYGLQSIYGHMNRIDVKEGDMVTKNQSLGLAGETGLAGGVHVHFGLQIDGVQVNPREWWDEHWIKDRIAAKLAAQ
jgi:hypothetical protein